jgi:jumonji domain-containing protein 2
MSLKEYRAKMGVFDRITDGLSSAEVEAMFWKNIVFSPPIYGADLLQTLMDERAASWNLNHLNSLLDSAIDINVRGVTSAYCYIGSWKTLFCWHKEDLDLAAINFLHEGKSKFWYSIPASQSHILEREAKVHFPEHFSRCSEHLRHKTTLINPYNLKRKYPELKISKM